MLVSAQSERRRRRNKNTHFLSTTILHFLTDFFIDFE